MGFSRVQNASDGNPNASSLTITLGSTPTLGNLLIAWANSDATVTIGGSGWTAGPSVVDGNGAYMWWKIVGVSEPSSAVFTPSTTEYICAGLLEYSGNPTGPPDVSGSYAHTSIQVSATGPVSVTTTAAHDLGVAIAALHSFPTAAPTSPSWTNSWNNLQAQSTPTGSTRTFTFVADNLDLGAAGSVSTGVSWSGSTWADAQELLMTFKTSQTISDLSQVYLEPVTAPTATPRDLSQVYLESVTAPAATPRDLSQVYLEVVARMTDVRLAQEYVEAATTSPHVVDLAQEYVEAATTPSGPNVAIAQEYVEVATRTLLAEVKASYAEALTVPATVARKTTASYAEALTVPAAVARRVTAVYAEILVSSKAPFVGWGVPVA